MADLATMKQAAASQGATAPANYPGGPDAWVQAWFNNAVKAGSLNPDGSAGMIHNEQEGKGYNFSQNVSGTSGLQKGQTPSPDQLRQYAKEQGWPEDFNRYDNATLQQWINNSWNPSNMMFNSEHGGASVYKPVDTGAGETLGGAGGGGGGGGGGAYSAAYNVSGGGGQAGAVPQFNAPTYHLPTAEEAFNTPGYQFGLQQGIGGLDASAAAKGVLRSGGTLKGINDWANQYATQGYQNAVNNSQSAFGLNYQGAKDTFAPQYGGWQTMYGGDLQKYLQAQNANLSKWTTGQNANLQYGLQRENNIYGLINQPMPNAPTY